MTGFRLLVLPVSSPREHSHIQAAEPQPCKSLQQISFNSDILRSVMRIERAFPTPP